ncbi:thioredoxin-dependent thiol peroxidase [Candidatus Saccharibacteria bacterium]|nr:thioredoxin-dependent thiol peroxidase [Candidatus Saccharibacteria bacterium]
MNMDFAPNFSLPDTNGTIRNLSDYKGKWLVLYFYPKDMTPGCTTEACSFRDNRDKITDLGAEVIGISRDNASSHDKFKTKYNLNFTLLTDTDHSVMSAYGAWGKKQFGREGVLRKTFIINPAGKIVKTYGRVTPIGHGEQVLKDLALLINNK